MVATQSVSQKLALSMETRVNNRPAIIVILGANSSATRWGDAKNILNSLATRRTV